MAYKVKFATQIDSEVLAKTKALAQEEGRMIQSVVEEALMDLVERRSKASTRPEVMAVYEATIACYGSVYERLAK